MRPCNYQRGKYYLVTRRCTQRKFLLLAGKLADALFLYALGNARLRTHMKIIGYVVLNNHYHLVVYDAFANIAAFAHHLNMFVARSFNKAFERAENFWASDSMSVVELPTRQAVVDKLAYTLANPVKAGLVGRASAWFGLTSWHAMLDGKTRMTPRPRVFYRKTAPEFSTVPIEIPDGPDAMLGPRAKFIADVVAAVRVIENGCDAERRKNGTKVMQRDAVLKQRRESSPTSRHKMFGLRPRVACRSQWARVAALQRNREFEAQHAAAVARLRAGLVPDFPVGTVAMKHLVLKPDGPPAPPLLNLFGAPPRGPTKPRPRNVRVQRDT